MLDSLLFLAIGLCLIMNCTSENGSRTGSREVAKPKVGFEANMSEIEAVVNSREQNADWQTVYQAAVALGDLKDKRSEEAFLKILERKEPIKLHRDSMLPGAMSPLNMLKAVAMESLRETGGTEYLEEFYKIYQETDECILREKAREHIQALGGTIPE